jgi:PAS domain S-box-containing protein
MHYLQHELYERLGAGGDILDFLMEAGGDGISYRDVKSPDEGWMSRGFWRALGYDPDAEPRKGFWQDVVHPDDLEKVNTDFQAHATDPVQLHEQVVRYKHGETGKWVWVRCRAIALRDESGTPVRMLGVHSDVTALHEAEGVLRGTVEELMDARTDLEAAVQAKIAFLEQISHEIRTPMNGILGMAQALVMQDLPIEATSQVAVINRSATALLTLLNDLLDMAQIEAGTTAIEMAPVAPFELVHDAAILFECMARDKGLDIVTLGDQTLPPQVLASGRTIRQVIGNLVSNAVKYAGQGTIEVRAYFRQGATPGAHTLLVSVVDTGPGIPDAQKDAVFDRFAQGDVVPGQGEGGPGLGLPIARQLCQLHGGDLTLTDTPGGGATFNATFVVQSPNQAPQEVPQNYAPQQGKDPLQILVVEDNEMNQMVLKALLGHMNAELVFANNGLEGLNLVQKQTFDAGFIDIRMPVMSGTEFAQEWRALEQENAVGRLPLIACSAHVLKHQVETYVEAGFDRHLPKPVTLDGLRDCINWVRSVRGAYA